MTGPGEPVRALVVGFVESIHTVRAVEPMTELGWDVHVFASHPHWANSAWRDVTLHVDPGFVPPDPDPTVRVEYMAPGTESQEPVIEGLSWRQRAGALATVIEDLHPELIDSMEIQHGGYLVLETRPLLNEQPPPWLVHNWGSDVFYYGRNPRHLGRLRGVFENCDFYGAECHRDIGLARAFGFKGRVLPVLPNTGGFDLTQVRKMRQPGPSSSRRTIALKAANTFVYRPDTALEALESCSDLIQGYTLALYTASEDIVERARRFGERAGVELELMSEVGALATHDEILAMHGRSRVSISLSESDAICTSFLEAMVMGAFPIQSNTGCSAAWAEDGHGAFFVDPDDPEAVAEALRQTLVDDALVDAAAESNTAVATVRLDRRVLLARMMDAYERIAVEVRGGGAGEGLDPVAMADRLSRIVELHNGTGKRTASELRRERLALLYLEPSEDPPARLELPPEATEEDRETLVADLLWVLDRQAEQVRGERVEWPSGEIAEEERIEEFFDSELVERDAHIASLRAHVSAMQQSLEELHQRLETSPPPLPRGWRRLLPAPLRARGRRTLNALRGRSRGEG